LQGFNYKLTLPKSNKIGLWDVLDTCDGEGNADSKIINPIVNNFTRLLTYFPALNTLIFNGKNSYHYFISLVDFKVEKKCLQLSSTTNVYGHKILAEKIEE
jgi:hypoxanthine-DNA glycosylase